MLKRITILTIMILSLAVSNCFAQGLTVIVDKIKSIEDKLDQVDTKLNGEIEKLKGQISNIKPTKSDDGSTESIKALQSQVNALSDEMRSIKNMLAANSETQQVDYAGLYLQIEQLSKEMASLQDVKSEEPPQYAGLEVQPAFAHHEETEEPPEWYNTGLEITGFFDFVSSYEGTRFEEGSYHLGEAEIGFAKEISHSIAVEAAVAYNSHDGVFELGAAVVEAHLFGEERDDAPLWNLNAGGLVLGQFDVPFGIDLNYYPAIDLQRQCHYRLFSS